MTLVIEDGTGVECADSYVTAVEASALEVSYFGGTATVETDPPLRRAWVYMSGLEWKPDTFPLFDGTIPPQVKLAQTVLARAEAGNAGALSPDVTLSGKKVLTGVKGITWDVQSGPNTVDAARPVVTMAMDLLRPYLAHDPARSGARTTFLDRA